MGTPGLNLRLVDLPGYSPDFNADEAIWGWVREEATGNLCLGTKTLVQERVGGFLADLTSRRAEVKRRCRTRCNRGLKGSCKTPRPIANPKRMHIPPWLGFSMVSNPNVNTPWSGGRRASCAKERTDVARQ